VVLARAGRRKGGEVRDGKAGGRKGGRGEGGERRDGVEERAGGEGREGGKRGQGGEGVGAVTSDCQRDMTTGIIRAHTRIGCI
jgi:hypothetical protein